MTTEDFNKVIENRVKRVKDTLIEKAKEYAKQGEGENRLHNFDRASQITGQIREKALWGFAMKHYVSVMDILDGIEKGELPTEARLDEKLGDLIVYSFLLEASIKDRLNKLK